MDKHMEVMINCYGMAAAPAAPQMFGNAGREHMEKYGKHCSCVKGWKRLFLMHKFLLCLYLDLSQALNQNTLPKSPGRTTNIPLITRKRRFPPVILESVFSGFD